MTGQAKNHRRVADVFPDFATELQELLIGEGRPELAAQVLELQIVDRCRCGDDLCATFYTRPKPKGSWGPVHEIVSLSPGKGMIILDVVNDAIACVEILYRDDFRQTLFAALP